MQCPKCAYVRKAEDHVPEWQCPACQVVYAKACTPSKLSPCPPPAANPFPTKSQETSWQPLLKIVVTLALIAFIGYGGYNFFSGITIIRETSNDIVTASPITAPDRIVLLYSATGCKYCKKAKEFLSSHNIAFEDIDVYNSERGTSGNRPKRSRRTSIISPLPVRVTSRTTETERSGAWRS